MPKIFAPELDFDERISLLKAESDSINNESYERELTEDEVNEIRESYLELTFKIDKLDEEFSEQKAFYKANRKPFEIELLSMKEKIKTRKETVVGTLYSIANHHEGMMEVYNDRAELVSTRRLRPSEKQLRISSFNKNVVNE